VLRAAVCFLQGLGAVDGGVVAFAAGTGCTNWLHHLGILVHIVALSTEPSSGTGLATVA